MKNKIIYMLSANYGGMENWFEGAFENESDRNEIALAMAEEVECANFNLNLAAYLNCELPYEMAIEFAMACSKNENGWSYANELITTWEVPLYGG